MKGKVLNKTTILILIVIVIATSCKKEPNPANSPGKVLNEFAASLKPVPFPIKDHETILTYHDSVIHYDSISSHTNHPTTKTETYSTNTQLLQSVDTYLQSVLPTNITMGNCPECWVGVIADLNTGCGNYDILEVGMHDEDDNCATTWGGWQAGIRYQYQNFNYRNFVFTFCIVPAGDFNRSADGDYAVLNLNVNTLPNGVSSMAMYEDNEDSGNHNIVYDRKNSIWRYLTGSGPYPVTYAGDGPNYFAGNTSLSFWYFRQLNGGLGWPTLSGFGTEYGLFGKLGGNTGYVYVDDEDDDCINSVSANIFNDANGMYSYTSTYQNGYLGVNSLIEINPKNTTYSIFKAY